MFVILCRPVLSFLVCNVILESAPSSNLCNIFMPLLAFQIHNSTPQLLNSANCFLSVHHSACCTEHTSPEPCMLLLSFQIFPSFWMLFSISMYVLLAAHYNLSKSVHYSTFIQTRFKFCMLLLILISVHHSACCKPLQNFVWNLNPPKSIILHPLPSKLVPPFLINLLIILHVAQGTAHPSWNMHDVLSFQNCT